MIFAASLRLAVIASPPCDHSVFSHDILLTVVAVGYPHVPTLLRLRDTLSASLAFHEPSPCLGGLAAPANKSRGRERPGAAWESRE